jgi:nicotinamidase-related amidase
MDLDQSDLHGNVPDRSGVALLLVDVINDFEFPGGDSLFRHALPAAKRLAALKHRARESGVPSIYANDNFGRWQSDFREVLGHCINEPVRGQPIARLLLPDPEDYFVLKPKHSAFFSTTLDTLLRYLGAHTLVIAGFAGDICVLFTANDAYMRDFGLRVPEDCLASQTARRNREALELMRLTLHADTRPSTALSFTDLMGVEARSERTETRADRGVKRR